MSKRGRLVVLASRSGVEFGKRVVDSMNLMRFDNKKLRKKYNKFELHKMLTTDFSDDEVESEVPLSVRGADVYLIQQCHNPYDGRKSSLNSKEGLVGIRALRTAGAEKITYVVPLHPGGRSDRTNGRIGINGRLEADFITIAGANNVLTFDLHADQMEGFYDVNKTKLDNLKASNVIIPKLEEIIGINNLSNSTSVSVDAGGAKLAQHYANILGSNLALGYKKRSIIETQTVEIVKIMGKLKNIIYSPDDLIDTGGSVIKLIEKGREINPNITDIILACTFPLFNKNAVEDLRNANVQVIGTDAIYRGPEFIKANPWYHEVSIAPVVANSILNLNQNKSLESCYKD
ncbi:MAG: ribose-phosphate pyrophosphokinase [Nanoarchaeota archaeon]|nr:ribose-phosphate pyrophosphokinase [Nanoarchaeota archaeon]